MLSIETGPLLEDSFPKGFHHIRYFSCIALKEKIKIYALSQIGGVV
jgi:hypothetical protein